ncbi:hypothetical protein PGT21_033061 [Puccinia graminis f. sp. tritici]|uniref:Uncharacterized protein n=1 Tax=Puccinia graminis f. sp. tritici TaxID=56615 RepID=A0A5B0M6G5_PUCGR|nr:hypothetical protein PGT21_033061 [Puccinia graminis f. sp. tritici]
MEVEIDLMHRSSHEVNLKRAESKSNEVAAEARPTERRNYIQRREGTPSPIGPEPATPVTGLLQTDYGAKDRYSKSKLTPHYGQIAVAAARSVTQTFRAKPNPLTLLKFQDDLKSYPTTRPSIPRQLFSRTKTSVSLLLAITAYQLTKPTIQLDAALPPQTFDPQPQQPIKLEPEELSSLLSVQKFSFGTLTGICAGVSLIKINWKTWANQYKSKFWSAKEPPTKSIVARFLDFLRSDFQYRSTSLGFFLGLRIG